MKAPPDLILRLTNRAGYADGYRTGFVQALAQVEQTVNDHGPERALVMVREALELAPTFEWSTEPLLLDLTGAKDAL